MRPVRSPRPNVAAERGGAHTVVTSPAAVRSVQPRAQAPVRDSRRTPAASTTRRAPRPRTAAHRQSSPKSTTTAAIANPMTDVAVDPDASSDCPAIPTARAAPTTTSTPPARRSRGTSRAPSAITSGAVPPVPSVVAPRSVPSTATTLAADDGTSPSLEVGPLP